MILPDVLAVREIDVDSGFELHFKINKGNGVVGKEERRWTHRYGKTMCSFSLAYMSSFCVSFSVIYSYLVSVDVLEFMAGTVVAFRGVTVAVILKVESVRDVNFVESADLWMMVRWDSGEACKEWLNLEIQRCALAIV